jgi:UDP-glucose 4-epimerase
VRELTSVDEKLAGSRILVTGATGYIGSRLIERLVHSGADVHGVSRSAQPEDARGVRWWHADLQESDVIAETVASVEPDVVFHLGGLVSGQPSPELVLSTIRTNLLSTIGVLESARQVGCRRVLTTASMVEPELGPHEDPSSSPYSASKWASWGYTRMFHALWDVPAAVLRLGLVYGPGQSDPGKLIPYVVTTLLDGGSPSLTSGGDQFDWVYIDDVVEALILAAVAPDIEGDTVEIGSGQLTSVREIVEQLARIANPEAQLSFGAVPDRPLPPPARVANTEHTLQVLEWEATTPLDKGLERTVAWFRHRLSAAAVLGAQSAEMVAQLPVVA